MTSGGSAPAPAVTAIEARPSIGGLILAGGRSSRFGREKAVAEFGGEPLVASVWRVLRNGCSAVALSARPGSGAAAFAAANALPCLLDAPGDADGPLAGVRAGLLWAVSQGFGWLATAPCDTPLLPLNMVSLLYASGQTSGAVVETSDGMEPLCALWPVSALDTLGSPKEHPPIRRVLKHVGAACVRFEDAGAFTNLNTPEDYARAKLRPG